MVAHFVWAEGVVSSSLTTQISLYFFIRWGDILSIFDKYSKDELEMVIYKYDTWREILSELGSYDKHNKMLPTLKKRLDYLGIDYSFMDNKPIKRKEGVSRNQFTKHTDEEVFRRNNGFSTTVVKRAFKEHIEIPYECAICHLPPIWQGKPLVLTMDHIDGDTDNNEFTNLRWICPNCDRQLDTYANRNKKRSSARPLLAMSERKTGKDSCPLCGREKEKDAKCCVNCWNELKRVTEWPSRDVLKFEIRTFSFSELSRKYNVSDNAIRKWCKYYGLPHKKSDINKISDKDWIKI